MNFRNMRNTTERLTENYKAEIFGYSLLDYGSDNLISLYRDYDVFFVHQKAICRLGYLEDILTEYVFQKKEEKRLRERYLEEDAQVLGAIQYNEKVQTSKKQLDYLDLVEAKSKWKDAVKRLKITETLILIEIAKISDVKERLILKYRYIDEYSYREIADKVGVSVGRAHKIALFYLK